ncbi:MAG: hypothetical protein AAFU33_15570 [Bacteroidota bacterium]
MENNFDELMNEPEGKVGLNLAIFKDPVAKEVSWKQMHEGGNSFMTHKLQLLNDQVSAFQPVFFAKLIPVIFFLAGLLLIGLAIFDPASINVMLFIGILIFWGAGILLTDQLMIYTIFDQDTLKVTQKRWFRSIFKREDAEKQFDLTSLYAIQLLSERISSYDEENDRSSSYRSYELNVIFENKERLHILDHANIEQIRADAQALAASLGIPVWDQQEAELPLPDEL